jgi:hypothetical protein
VDKNQKVKLNIQGITKGIYFLEDSMSWRLKTVLFLWSTPLEITWNFCSTLFVIYHTHTNENSLGQKYLKSLYIGVCVYTYIMFLNSHGTETLFVNLFSNTLINVFTKIW